jgi:CheY-like chemotaxis protein
MATHAGPGAIVVGGESPLPAPGGRVLVVDDEPDVREAVETALELEGHRVATAVDGLDALKRLGRGEFDAIVLDVLMPNVNGSRFAVGFAATATGLRS